MHKDVAGYWSEFNPTQGTLADFAFEYSDGTCKIFKDKVCHAMLSEQNKRSMITAFSSALKCDTQKKAKDYFDFILDIKTSPWRLAFQDTSPEKIKNKAGKLVAFRLPSLEKIPGQVLTHLCMASRLPYEFPFSLALYNRLRKAGMSQLDAFYCILFLEETPQGKINKRSGNQNHFLVRDLIVPVSYKRLKEGNPYTTKGLYLDGEGGSYDGCSNMWFGGEFYPEEIYKILSPVKQYAGRFARLFKSRQSLIKKQVDVDLGVKKLLELRKEWNGEEGT